MKKLQHQNSCASKPSDSYPHSQSHTNALHQTELSSSLKQKELKSLQGQILLLQQRNKTIQQFYQQKISQLKLVLSKQNQTKSELVQELTRLSLESRKQNRYVMSLKAKMEETDPSGRAMKYSQQLAQPLETSLEKGSLRKGSKSKGKLLFASSKMAVGSSKLLLKKSRSLQYFECEYFIRDGEGQEGTQGATQPDRQTAANPERQNVERHRGT